METSNNHVELTGRLSVDPVERDLPSGDRLMTFRLVVPRMGAVLRRSKQKVDVIECTAWTKALQRQVARLHEGDVVRVSGQLRRRFVRGTTPMSWTVVDLEEVHRS